MPLNIFLKAFLICAISFLVLNIANAQRKIEWFERDFSQKNIFEQELFTDILPELYVPTNYSQFYRLDYDTKGIKYITISSSSIYNTKLSLFNYIIFYKHGYIDSIFETGIERVWLRGDTDVVYKSYSTYKYSSDKQVVSVTKRHVNPIDSQKEYRQYYYGISFHLDSIKYWSDEQQTVKISFFRTQDDRISRIDIDSMLLYTKKVYSKSFTIEYADTTVIVRNDESLCKKPYEYYKGLAISINGRRKLLVSTNNLFFSQFDDCSISLLQSKPEYCIKSKYYEWCDTALMPNCISVTQYSVLGRSCIISSSNIAVSRRRINFNTSPSQGILKIRKKFPNKIYMKSFKVPSISDGIMIDKYTYHH